MRTKQSKLHLKTAVTFNRRSGKAGILPLLALMIASLVLAGMLAGCSGGSSGSGTGTVSALSLPNRVELSGSSDDSSSSGAFLRSFGAAAADADTYNASGTDYNAAESHVWVDDTNALDMVNDILGVIKDTAYDQFLNEGPYLALVKQVGDEQTSQTGSSGTSTTTEQLMEMVVDVSRASNSDPMIVKIWVNEDDGPGGQSMLIRGYFTVWAGAGDTYEGVYYPYGKLEAHFKGTDSSGTDLFHMAMSIGAAGDGKIQIQHVEDSVEGGGFEWHNKVNAIASSDMSSGNAYVYEAETDWETSGLDEETYYIAYNEDYFKVQDEDDNITVYSRDRDDMTYMIHRYQLFNTDGSAVELSSGFPVKFESGGSVYHGYIGYYGMWMPEGVSVSDGDQLVGEENGNTYTLIKKGGKLKKHTKATITLSKLDGIEMSKWNDGTDTVFTYDADSNRFVQLGIRSEDTNWQVVETGAGTEITFDNDWDGAWCESLQAWLPLGTLGSSFNGDTILTYHKETTVMPGDENVFPSSDLTLHYFDPNSNQWIPYTYSVDDLMLEDAVGNPVVPGAGSQSLFIMPLVLDTDYSTVTTDPGSAFTLDTYYSWSAGSEEWNQLSVLQDADGDYVSFDAPLHFTYTHQTAYDINGDSSNDGKIFSLEYDGFSLQVPWAFDETEDQWRPLFNLKNSSDGGPTLTDDNDNEYVVKMIEASLIMTEVDSSLASDLTIDDTVAEPTLEYDATKTALVGDKPTDVELKVIKGELVE